MAHVPATVRRAQIITAATAVIAREGVADATTRRIAGEAKLSLATLHYVFATKDDILAAVLESFIDRTRQDNAVIAGHLAGLPGSGPPALPDVIHRLVRAACDVLQDDLMFQRAQAGHEGRLYPDLDREEVDRIDPTAFLTTPVLDRPGQVDLLCLAPLTNVATAIRHTPELARDARSMVVMGGRWFGPGAPEHNFASDVEAARVVFGSGAAIRVVGLDITEQVTFDPAAVEGIARSGALGSMLAAETRQWLRVFDDMRNTPHDAVTAIALLEPDLFEFTPPGRVRIDTTFDRAGSSTFTPDPMGTVRIATAVDVPAVTRRILANISRAGARGTEPRRVP